MEADYFKGIKIGVPGRMEENLDYGEDSIERNIIFSKKKATFVEFAMSPEKGLVTNKAKGDVHINVLSGEIEVDLDGNNMTVKEGEYVVLPKGLPHSIETDLGAKITFLIVQDIFD